MLPGSTSIKMADEWKTEQDARGLLEKAAEASGWSKEDVIRIMSLKYGVTSVGDMGLSEFNDFLKYIEKHPVSADTIRAS